MNEYFWRNETLAKRNSSLPNQNFCLFIVRLCLIIFSGCILIGGILDVKKYFYEPLIILRG